MYKSLSYILTLLVLCSLNCYAGIGQRTYYYKDTLRNRPLTVELWYPTEAKVTRTDSPKFSPFVHEITIRQAPLPLGRHPLILISHGTGGNRLSLEWLADALVNNGFIVAAVDHWGNTSDNKIPIDFVTPWQRPQDISYVLTCILKDSELHGVIDEQRIGAAGFSIGGYTVLALAGAKLNLDALYQFSKTSAGRQETNIPELPDMMKKIDTNEVMRSFKNSPPLKDKRIRAFFAMSPAIGQGFTSAKQFDTDNPSIDIVVPESDNIAPAKTNGLHYHDLMKGSGLMIIPGKAGHYVFLPEAADVVKKEAPVYFTDDPTIDRHAVHQQVAESAVKFFSEKLK